jgi:hypothetical protein
VIKVVAGWDRAPGWRLVSRTRLGADADVCRRAFADAQHAARAALGRPSEQEWKAW